MKRWNQAFPLPATNLSLGVEGMTYRQWLIGQALSGACARNGKFTHAAEVVETIMALVDAVLDRVEAE